jgi:uncharacterized membrane protein YjjB (DUF3815 family)
MRKKIPFIVMTAISTPLVGTAASWACSVCLTGTNDSVTDGFNASVLFLMSTPYLVVGSIVGGLFFAYRRGLRKHERTETADPIIPLGLHQEDAHR